MSTENSILTSEGLAMSQESARNVKLNELEAALVANFPPVECPVEHVFTPGMVSRTILMPKGAIVSSKIHRTEHQYVVMKGHAAVYVEGEGWHHLIAPYHGVTKAGTRRVLMIMEDCLWATFHPTNCKTVEELEAEIIEPHLTPADQLPKFHEALT